MLCYGLGISKLILIFSFSNTLMPINPNFNPQTFENFEFLKVLGKGTFGKVNKSPIFLHFQKLLTLFPFF